MKSAIIPDKEKLGEFKILDSGFSTESTGYYYLSMSAYASGYCGPASGVSIGRYYRDVVGYSNIYGYDPTLYGQLYININCAYWSGATLPTNYASGYEETMENCGYYNFNGVNDAYVTMSDYWTVVSNINSGHPTALMLTSEWHWRAIRGYDYDTDWGYHNIICTYSQNGASWEFLDWEGVVVDDLYAYTTCIQD